MSILCNFVVLFTLFLWENVLNKSIYTAHVINLPNRPERLESITRQLIQNGITYEVERALAPQNIDNEVQQRVSKRSSGMFDPETKLDFLNLNSSTNTIKKSEIACSQSHLQLLFKIAKSNTKEPVLILEDDANLSRNFYNRTVEILRVIPPSWEILNVGYCCESMDICDIGEEQTIGYCKKKAGRMLTCMHAYFINGARVASLILDKLNTPQAEIIDLKLHLATSNYFMSRPKLAKQFPFPSDNGFKKKK